MSFEQQPDSAPQPEPAHRSLPKIPLSYLAAVVLAVGAYETVNKIFDGVGAGIDGIAHTIHRDIQLIQSHKEAEIAAREALEDVSLPSYTPVVQGTVNGTGSLDSFTSWPLFGGDFPGTTEGVDLTQTGTVAIMAPDNAVVSRTIHELPNSTLADPKFGATIKVNVDTLYPQILSPNTPLNKDGQLEVTPQDGFLSSVKHTILGGAPGAKYTAELTNVEDSYMKVKCAQAMAPLVQAGFQHNFYEDIQATKMTPDQVVQKNSAQVARYILQLNSGAMPVTVDLVNSKGQPVSQDFTMNDGNELISNQSIAQTIGVGESNMELDLASPCESTPTAVEQQVAIQEGYLSHTGAAAVNVSYGG